MTPREQARLARLDMSQRRIERNKRGAIAWMLRGLVTLRELAKLWGISADRARQIGVGYHFELERRAWISLRDRSPSSKRLIAAQPIPMPEPPRPAYLGPPPNRVFFGEVPPEEWPHCGQNRPRKKRAR